MRSPFTPRLWNPIGICVAFGTLWLLACAHSTVWGIPKEQPNAAPPSATPALLDAAEREHLTRFSKVANNVTFPVLIASKRGQNEAVAKQATALGGKITYRLDALDYLRVQINATGILALADVARIEALDIADYRDDVASWQALAPYYTLDPPALAPEAAGPAHGPEIVAPNAHTPADNPYLPTRDMGAPQFMAAHPTFDGRGVTIAVVEGIPNLLSPELNQPAITLNGQPTHKLAGISPGFAFDADKLGLYAVPTEPVIAVNGSFVVKGVSYTAPSPTGTFRFGIYDIQAFGFSLPGFTPHFAILWDERSGRAWVDTNQNNSFADELPLRDYNMTFD